MSRILTPGGVSEYETEIAGAYKSQLGTEDETGTWYSVDSETVVALVYSSNQTVAGENHQLRLEVNSQVADTISYADKIPRTNGEYVTLDLFGIIPAGSEYRISAGTTIVQNDIQEWWELQR